MLINGMNTLRFRCIDGITANEEHCRSMVEKSIGLVTALVPWLGYKSANELAKEALSSGESVYSLVLSKNLLSKEKLDQILVPENMLRPGKMKDE
jgi:aspartate ammonia-lyase